MYLYILPFPTQVLAVLSREIPVLQQRTGITVTSLDRDLCLKEPCHVTATCDVTTTYVWDSEGVLVPLQSSQCTCPAGWRGSRCDDKVPCEVKTGAEYYLPYL